MTKQDFITMAVNLMEDFCSVPEDSVLASCGITRAFDAPLIGIAAADDPLFEQLKAPQAVGAHYLAPCQWLEGAKSVVSIFVPYSSDVKKANSCLPKDKIAPEYVYAKDVVVPYINALVEMLVSAVKAQGYSVVVPSCESERMKNAVITSDGSRLKYTSGWSERHAAFVCGLGSFGISGALITPKGGAGRFISLVTDMPLNADERPYSHIYEYCTLCGACAVKCPAEAITVENKKDKAKCSAFVNTTKEKFAPLYGCAKCQCGVPCANGKPKAE